MKKPLVPLAWLVVAALAACSPPTNTPPPTPGPTLSPTPPGPASCYLAPLRFNEVSVPPVTEADHSHGPADAEVVIFDYADFQ